MSFSRLLVMVALLVSVHVVSAQELPDFTGFEIVSRGFCVIDNEPVECMEVKKGEEVYIIMHTGYAIHFIFKVKKGATKPYTPDEMDVIFPKKREGLQI